MASAAVIGLFVYLTGLCVGSFLNVVVYRLPRGLSLSKPAWSFCPHCRTTLRWYDNLPVLGWLLLKARCRYCDKPISAQYPLVEAITGLAFVLVHHLLFVAHARVLGASDIGVVTLATTWPTDAPLLLAWLILAAVLVACATMDLLLYVIDTRVTDVAVIGGIILYALWPRAEFVAPRAVTPAAAAALVAAIVSLVMLWRSNAHEEPAGDDPADEQHAGGHTSATPVPAAQTVASAVAVIAFVALALWLLFGSAVQTTAAGGPLGFAAPAALLAMFTAMVLAGGQPRDVDEELRATIEAEAPSARKEAMRELLWLAPATLAGVVTYFVVAYVEPVGAAWARVAAWRVGGFIPLGGAAFAVHGAIIGAAAGWIIRVFFTLAFGREAFGTGDIYILAAAGAIAGWDIALLGFLLSVFIALLGWILGLLLKRPGMIPFGPPLAIGFLVALWLNQRAAESAHGLYGDIAELWRVDPRRAVLLLGVILVVLPISILLAKLVRRVVEPPGEEAEGAGRRDGS
jgi:prepilin signal peptidase PulO-like enzyme (type II secretory pathway)